VCRDDSRRPPAGDSKLQRNPPTPSEKPTAQPPDGCPDWLYLEHSRSSVEYSCECRFALIYLRNDKRRATIPFWRNHHD
jgi:hypothetical protein